MPRQRPTIVSIVAILHFVFGGIGLLCNLCGGLMDAMGTPQAQARAADPQQARRKEVTEQVLSEKIPLYRAYTVGNRVSSLLSCLLMIASGVGLMLMQSWGRWLSVVYAALSILVNLVVLVYTIVFFTPAYEEVYRRLPPQSDQERIAKDVAQVAGPGFACFVLIYPALVLVVMLLPSVGAAFRPRKKRSRFARIEE
ncbi:MAG TPA: hypothetical protein VH643_29820 [Gemmataceae bacterium]|jgi:hypothetical protein